jgi:hypothetical protein
LVDARLPTLPLGSESFQNVLVQADGHLFFDATARRPAAFAGQRNAMR